VPVGEFFMFLTVIPISARIIAQEDRRTAVTLESGALFALAIAGGYALACLLLEVF
jgi:hypothetical protein